MKKENTWIQTLVKSQKSSTPGIVIGNALLCLFFAICLTAGTYAWYKDSRKVTFTDSEISSAPKEVNSEVGHDTYMYDLTKTIGQGIQVDVSGDSTVTMNEYDTIFTQNNDKTPIILRAIIDPVLAENNKDSNGLLKLNLNMVSSNKKGENGFIRENGKDYLSSVTSYRVGYIQGLADKADALAQQSFPYTENGVTYQSVDDYIYQQAVSTMKSWNTFDFWDEKSAGQAEKTSTTTVSGYPVTTSSSTTTYTLTEITDVSKIKAVGSATTNTNTDTQSTSTNPVTNDDGTTSVTTTTTTTVTTTTSTTIGYLIGSNNYFINSSLTATQYTGAGTNTAPENAILWNLGVSNSNIKIQNISTSKYLQAWMGSLSVQNSSEYWTLSSNGSGVQLRYNNNDYLKQSTNSFSASMNSTTVHVYQVEQVVVTQDVTTDKTIKTTTPAVAASYDNKLTIDVDLKNAQADNGFYYIYVMIDYDNTLISRYQKLNNLSLLFDGTSNGVLYTDQFTFTIASNSSS